MGSENSSGAGAGGAGAGAGVGGVWKSGNLEIWEYGDQGTWKSRNLGSNESKKNKLLNIQIRSAQNVGKVWISRKEILLALFGAI